MLTRRALIASAAAAFETLASRLVAQASAGVEGIRYGLGFDDITSLDPHMAVLSSDIPMVANIYDGLVTVPPIGRQLWCRATAPHNAKLDESLREAVAPRSGSGILDRRRHGAGTNQLSRTDAALFPRSC